MDAAVRRILHAIDQQERIVLFGDYDVDGVTSLALLADLLRAYGSVPALFLPHRLEEGYGLSSEALARCVRQDDPQLLIAVDCGTSSVLEIAQLRAQKIDVIVVDHHEPQDELPDSILVNPKVAGAEFSYLCSAGLTFKLCHALLKTRRIDFELKDALDLVALGTVADIVPLQDDNRTMVKTGARVLARSKRPGLVKLIEAAGVKAPIMPEDIGFRLGPRLNAAGRLATAEKALQLLLTPDPLEAATLAKDLDQQNRARQEVERRIVQEAEAEISECFDPTRDAAIILGRRGWHPGVLGIVASRITRRYHRPTFIIGFEEDGSGKGSGRSIEGFNLVAALKECATDLEKFGGHEMAAGISLSETNFAAFREHFLAVARAALDDDALAPKLHLDGLLCLTEIDYQLLHWHEMLQPFGTGNRQPLFVSSGVEPAAPPRVVGERHLAMRLKQGNWQQRAIYFDGGATELPPPPWDVAYRIRADEYEGETRIQLQVHDIRAAGDFA